MLTETDEDDPPLDAEVARSSSSGLLKVPQSEQVVRSSMEEAASTPRPRSQADAQLEFIQLVLHDLQNPVAVLDASIRSLLSDFPDENPEATAMIRDAQRAGRRIQQYIDHLVTSAKVFNGPLRRRDRVDVASLLTDLCEEYSCHASIAGSSLELDLGRRSSLSLRADTILLHRVFQNLLENSLRHARSGRRVLVRARGGSVIEVRFCNDGPPILDAERERIFDKFVGGLQNSGSAGIGLYFCRLAVEAHSGTIVVEDDPEWPTCFVVRLPTAAI